MQIRTIVSCNIILGRCVIRDEENNPFVLCFMSTFFKGYVPCNIIVIDMITLQFRQKIESCGDQSHVKLQDIYTAWFET